MHHQITNPPRILATLGTILLHMDHDIYLTIDQWGELVLIDRLLGEYTLHSSPIKDNLYVYALSLRKKLLPALKKATDEIKI